MPTLVQVHFTQEGPWGAEMATGLKGLAESIAKEPGLIWKIWTENQEEKEAGGIYLFTDRASAEAYMEMHTKRLQGFGVKEVHARYFEVNTQLSEVTKFRQLAEDFEPGYRT